MSAVEIALRAGIPPSGMDRRSRHDVPWCPLAAYLVGQAVAGSVVVIGTAAQSGPPTRTANSP